MDTASGAKKGSSTAARGGRRRWHEEAELCGGMGTKTTIGTRGADFSVEDRTMVRAILGLFGSI
jgi:hypothetical protein